MVDELSIFSVPPLTGVPPIVPETEDLYVLLLLLVNSPPVANITFVPVTLAIVSLNALLGSDAFVE